MSDYHVLQVNEKDDSITVVFHIPVPDANNAGGYNWRLALKESLEVNATDGIITSRVPNIGAELTDIQSGATMEVVVQITGFNADTLTDQDKLTEVETQYPVISAKELADGQAKLKYWGKQGNVT
jgi:hypothetical protein